MNPRERCKMAILHKEPDRIPIDNNGVFTGMHEIAYKNLLEHLNIEDKISIYDPIQRLALVKDEIKDILGVDTRYIYANAPSNYKFIENPEGIFKDEFGVVFKKVGYYADCIIPPLRGKSFEEIKSFKLPDPSDLSKFEGVALKAKNLYENTEYSIWSGTCYGLFYLGWMLRGFQDFMTDIFGNPKIACYLLDKITDWMMDSIGGFLSHVGPYIDVFWGGGDDYGYQDGPIISPDYFRKEIVPRVEKMISYYKTKTNALCAFHCCGSIDWCIEDFIEMGVDILHPVQANAKGNDTRKLKREFGEKISFHGGTNNQGVFHKDINTLTIDTLKRIKDLAPEGGYIFSSGHNIQANMTPENIIRFFEIGREYGKYPIDVEKIDQRIEEEKKLLTQDSK